jgi:hypothetical protein
MNLPGGGDEIMEIWKKGKIITAINYSLLKPAG